MQLEKTRIVAIDDDEVDLSLLRRAVREFGDMLIREFTELDAAIQFLQAEEYDLVLLDFYMPPQDGLESIARLQEELGTGIPIVVLTGRDDAGIHQRVISAGAQDCLCKSDLNGGQLYRALRNAKERQKLQEQLRISARTDFVTGLPNRCAMMEEIDSRLKNDSHFNLLIIDLDDFKLVNDGYGHDVGDELLRKFAATLETSLRPNDHLSRFGGDEFVLLLDGAKSKQEIDQFLLPINAALNSGFDLDGTFIYTRASMGIVSSAGFQGDAHAMLRDADTAMFKAKSNGKAQYAWFDHSMKCATLERLDLERGIRQAIVNEELELHYQPLIDLRDNRVIGCEALIRWCRGDACVSPETLTQIAEQSGDIHDIGNWVFVTAVQEASQWLREVPDLRIHINVSPAQLLRDDFIRIVVDSMRTVPLANEQVVLEITESKELEERTNAMTQLKHLKDLGFRISLDDFGTGYSSLSRLHRLPIDEVKIDRSFIAGLDDASTEESTQYCRAFVSAIQTLATAIGLDVYAEGIEAKQQLDLLLESDYRYGQGFLFAHPVPPAEMQKLLCQESRQQSPVPPAVRVTSGA